MLRWRLKLARLSRIAPSAVSEPPRTTSSKESKVKTPSRCKQVVCVRQISEEPGHDSSSSPSLTSLTTSMGSYMQDYATPAYAGYQSTLATPQAVGTCGYHGYQAGYYPQQQPQWPTVSYDTAPQMPAYIPLPKTIYGLQPYSNGPAKSIWPASWAAAVQQCPPKLVHPTSRASAIRAKWVWLRQQRIPEAYREHLCNQHSCPCLHQQQDVPRSTSQHVQAPSRRS